jgi:hypothetical protein
MRPKVKFVIRPTSSHRKTVQVRLISRRIEQRVQGAWFEAASFSTRDKLSSAESAILKVS